MPTGFPDGSLLYSRAGCLFLLLAISLVRYARRPLTRQHIRRIARRIIHSFRLSVAHPTACPASFLPDYLSAPPPSSGPLALPLTRSLIVGSSTPHWVDRFTAQPLGCSSITHQIPYSFHLSAACPTAVRRIVFLLPRRSSQRVRSARL